MKTTASPIPRVLATAMVVLSTLTVAGLPVSAQRAGPDARMAVRAVVTTEKARKAVSARAAAEHPQYSPLACRWLTRDEWLRDLNASSDGWCEFQRRISDYAITGQVPIPICFYPGKQEVPVEFRRVLVFNIELIKKQAVHRLPIYYLESIMGAEAEEHPFPLLACARGAVVGMETLLRGHPIGGTVYSRSPLLGRIVNYLSDYSPDHPPRRPMCFAN